MSEQRKRLTRNDRRMLESVQNAQGKWDGLAPHGSSDWVAIRRLGAAGLVSQDGDGWCETCPSGHDTPLFVLTPAGESTLAEVDPQ